MAEASALNGFQFGNHFHTGCLTSDAEVRIHSCEPGTSCHATLSRNPDLVWITPIISRSNGVELEELGAGGGGGDLYQKPELEILDDAAVEMLSKVWNIAAGPEGLLTSIKEKIRDARARKEGKISLEDLDMEADAEMSLESFVKLFTKQQQGQNNGNRKSRYREKSREDRLPSTIRFPYSRHSSCEELCSLVEAFRPKDIHPCTVDEASWTIDVSMRELFGQFCSGETFRHDQEMSKMVADRPPSNARKRKHATAAEDSQESRGSPTTFVSAPEVAEKEVEDQLHSPEEKAHVNMPHFSEATIAGVQQAVINLEEQSGQVTLPKSSKDNISGVRSALEALEQTRQDAGDMNADHVHGNATDNHRLQASFISTVSTESAASQDADSHETMGQHRQLQVKEASTQSTQVIDLISSDGSQETIEAQQAFRAAKASLSTGNSVDWDDLPGMRSMSGREGHSEQEKEL